MVTVGAMQAADLPQVLALLQRSGLPQDGFTDPAVASLVAKVRGAVVGSAALEVYGASALLRSVAVDSRYRGQRIGERPIHAAVDLARERGVQGLYLLTETADGYFPRFGFEPIARDVLLDAVGQSIEVQSACPASARAMHRALA